MAEIDESDTTNIMDCLAMIPKLPAELQHRIFDLCGRSTLAVMSRLNKAWHERVTPLLWTEIDFLWEAEGEDPVSLTRRFFAAVDNLMEDRPERWRVIATNVRKLNLGRLHGVNIVHNDDPELWDDFIYFDETEPSRRNIFDVIAQLPNLEELTVFVKNWWGYQSIEESGKALASGLQSLKCLKTGGQMSKDVLLGLLAKPENIEKLSLFNLIESPGQDNGPDGITFLSDISGRFTKLKSLHLCKLADLDGKPWDDDNDDEEDDGAYHEGDRDFVSKLNWRFPRESEVSVLEEWATMLGRCSSTIEELTLENRYLCGCTFDNGGSDIDPGVTHPVDYGAISIAESQKILFPVLSDEWPKLRELTLIGMGRKEDVTEAVHHLEPRVHINQCLAGIEIMAGDVTPMQISTPREFHDLED